MPFLASEGCFWPLTASMTSEVKKNHAHVYPYRNLRNFSEINFSIGPMVWPWIALWVHQDFLGLLIRYRNRYLQGSKNEVPINKESLLNNDQPRLDPGPFFDLCKENENSEKFPINSYLQMFWVLWIKMLIKQIIFNKWFRIIFII